MKEHIGFEPGCMDEARDLTVPTQGQQCVGVEDVVSGSRGILLGRVVRHDLAAHLMQDFGAALVRDSHAEVLGQVGGGMRSALLQLFSSAGVSMLSVNSSMRARMVVRRASARTARRSRVFGSTLIVMSIRRVCRREYCGAGMVQR